ncbi:uncharacterized protein PHACADRAFT_97905, partial [Phanerochaete carnosa HHB-10118-sp]
GPRVYTSSQDYFKTGSTKLYKNMFSLVNLMSFSTNDPSTGECGAVWQIVMPSDADRFSHFLCGTKGLTKQYPNLVHLQRYFLNGDMLSELRSKFGIWPFRIEQNLRHTVLVPPGALYQVREL